MKTVWVWRDYDYHPHSRVTVRFHAGHTYERVIESAAIEIQRAGAGRIIEDIYGCGGIVIDAGQVFMKKGKQS